MALPLNCVRGINGDVSLWGSDALCRSGGQALSIPPEATSGVRRPLTLILHFVEKVEKSSIELFRLLQIGHVSCLRQYLQYSVWK